MARVRSIAGWLPLLAAAVHIIPGLAGSVLAQAPAVDGPRAEYMIKNTLTALNHANLTGNYTVLRDLGSPRFRADNTAARLAAIFSPLREDGFDMAPIVLFEPQLLEPVSFDEEGRLRLVGQFPTRPMMVVFDVAYQSVGNRWLISDIAVNAVAWTDEAETGGKQDALQPSLPDSDE